MDDHIGEETQSVMTDQQQYIVVYSLINLLALGRFQIWLTVP